MTIGYLVGVLSLDFIDSEAKIVDFPERNDIHKVWYNVDANEIYIGNDRPLTGDWDCAWDDDAPPLYTCDPEKNINCKERNKPGWCGSECYMTIHKEFAKDDNIRKELDISSNADPGYTAMEMVEQRNSKRCVLKIFDSLYHYIRGVFH